MFQIAICNDEGLFCEYMRGQILAFCERIQAEYNIQVYNSKAELMNKLKQKIESIYYFWI